MKIGVPRALLYYNYYPGFKTLFECLGHDVTTSPKTDGEVMDNGVKHCVDDVCLPIKIYLGHVKKLVEDDEIKALFIPRFVGVERNRYLCPKLFGLPNLIKNQFEMQEKKFLSPKINLTRHPISFYKELIKIGQSLDSSALKTLKAYKKAMNSQNNYERKLLNGKTPHDILETTRDQSIYEKYKSTDNSYIKIGVIGHSYNINDAYINHDLINKLRESGVKVITTEMIGEDLKLQGLKDLEKPIFWTFGKEIIGTAYYALKKEIFDGIILVVSFGCGPDSLINEFVEREMKYGKIPLLMLTLDEHTGEAGLNTRIEAFVEMLKRRKLAV